MEFCCLWPQPRSLSIPIDEVVERINYTDVVLPLKLKPLAVVRD